MACFRTLPTHWRSAVITFPGNTDNTLPNDLAPLAGAGSSQVADFGQSRLVNSTRADAMASGSGSAEPGSIGSTSFLTLAPSPLRRPLSVRDVPDDVQMAPEQMLTRTVGTPLWSAPELLSGSITYGKPIDVYSFAIIM